MFKNGDMVTLKPECLFQGKNYVIRVLDVKGGEDDECFKGQVVTSEFSKDDAGGLLCVGVIDNDFMFDCFQLVKGE